MLSPDEPVTLLELVAGLGAALGLRVIQAPLASGRARLDTRGGRPVLTLDTGSSAASQTSALVEAVGLLTSGPSAAPTARRVRQHLHAVDDT